VLDAVWLIPALPLAGFLILLFAGKRLGEPAAGWLATVMCTGSFVASVVVFAGLLGENEESRQFTQTLFEWVPAGGLRVDVGFLADPLSITMALFVTGVSALIHLYSIGYMHGDADYAKFFVYMNLFVFSMLVLVLGSNLLVTFLGWEGVGACSYWLIAFWFSSEANATAGKKAFITNRIGDWGFLVAMFLAFATVGTLNYEELFASVPTIAPVTATAIGLLLLLGAVGKSAQIPLYIWLPDAMLGPTPVSALIHAATMVTAGVFLLTRVNPILGAGYDWVPDIIAWGGVITAFVAATIAVVQNDIKKVLAYSTVSQLGYMFLAVGVGAYVAAIFHMLAHAFFKALLFLGAGSVIHGMGGEQDMRRMGGLRKFMPVTAATFMVGWLAIAGVPPFAGFWSKDDILLFAWGSGGADGKALWGIGLVTALLTGYYMSRQVFMVFFGEPRWQDAGAADLSEAQPALVGAADDAITPGAAGDAGEATAAADPGTAIGSHGPPDEHAEPHESPWIMTVPLVALSVLAIAGGVINLPFSEKVDFLSDFLHPVLGVNEAEIAVSTGAKVALAVVAVGAGLVGLAIAAAVYLRHRVRAIEPGFLAHAWYYDEAVTAFVGGPGTRSFDAIAWFDAHVIDGAVNGVAAVVRNLGGRLRPVQSGFVRSYALGVTIGVVVVLGYFITRVTF
jgi:NADH-quinone oxidoreductase subunit L